MMRKVGFISFIFLCIASFSWPSVTAFAAHSLPDISIDYDVPTEVGADQVVHLPGDVDLGESGTSGQNGYGYLNMPSDLPEGTILTVSKVSDVDNILDTNGTSLQRCGEVYAFGIETPEGTNYNEDFSITLPYCNGLLQPDIYTLNGNSNQWEKQHGELNNNFFDLTVHISELTVHGVFSASEIDQGIEDPPNKTEVTVPFNEKTAVLAGQKILIHHTNSWIIMPSDLPKGTTITIEDASATDMVTNEKQLNIAGDVITVTVQIPDDTSFKDLFTLVLSSDDKADDIYYYNEERGKWERQHGELNEDSSTISIKTDHFSTYGVFANSNVEEANYVCYEDEAEMSITINFDEETNVCPDQQILIGDTLNQIVLPSDLPDNTTLIVTNASEFDIVTNAEGLHRAGDVLQYTLKTPEDSSFTDTFLIKAPYANGVSADDIYYYDEAAKKWEGQGATFDYEDYTLNIEVPHLSIYGVFGKDEEEEVINEGEQITDDKKTSHTKNKMSESMEENESDPTNENEITTEVSIEQGEEEEEKTQGFLPNTATNLYNWLFIGGILMITGLVFLVIRKKQSRKHES